MKSCQYGETTDWIARKAWGTNTRMVIGDDISKACVIHLPALVNFVSKSKFLKLAQTGISIGNRGGGVDMCR